MRGMTSIKRNDLDERDDLDEMTSIKRNNKLTSINRNNELDLESKE